MKIYKHLFFDLDHTLWDFQANSSRTLRDLFEEHQLEERLQVTTDNFLDNYYRINDEKWALYRQGKITKTELRTQRFLEAFELYGFSDIHFSRTFEEAYINQSPYQKTLISGTLELLNQLQEADHYKMHIITNGFNEVQHIKLKNSGLMSYFDVIMTSEQVGVTKPHAKIFMESLQQAKAKRKESLMIGDNLVADVIGARNCGIDQVFFNPDAQKHEEKVTHEITHLSQLGKLLL